MALVAAICTHCGANIVVDNSKDAGICEYCGTAYVTEKVINVYNNTYNISNANITISNLNVDNLLLRAQEFEQNKDYNKALEYYNKVLDVDINNLVAKTRAQKLTFNKCGNSIVSDSDIKKCSELLSQGDKFEAISVIRSSTGATLIEAMDFLESHFSNISPRNNKKRVSQDNTKAPTKKEGCYIATCVYGSYDCPQVWTLRRYRDHFLRSRLLGRIFIKVYYAISPKIIKLFGKTKWFNKMWKVKLDKMVYKLNNKGVKNTPYNDR